MHTDLTNLLPEDRIHSLTRGYWMRVGTIAALAAAAVMLANAALLAPTYAFIESQSAAHEAELTALAAADASSGASTVTAELAAFTVRTNALVALGNASPDVPVLAEVLSVAHPGVSLTGFSFGTSAGATGKTVSITGTADTRDDLRAYDLALSSAPFAASVNLPVSDYAAATKVPFTMALTLVSP